MTFSSKRFQEGGRSLGFGRANCGSRVLLFGVSVLMWSGLLTGCASQQFREQDRIGRWMTSLEKHIHAPTAKAAMAHIAEDFVALADGNPRTELDRRATAELLEWEYGLHRSISMEDHRFDGETITAVCFAENDLSRLLDYPGWETIVTWTFDARGKITRASAISAPGAADFRNWLSPAINWLRQNRPADLEWLYPDGEWNHAPRAAARWVEVLTEWRRATHRRPIVLASARRGTQQRMGSEQSEIFQRATLRRNASVSRLPSKGQGLAPPSAR